MAHFALCCTLLLFGAVAAQRPPMWEEATMLNDLPLDHSTNTRVLDPWNYKQRLGSIKTVVALTSKSSPCLFPDEGANILWGLALQFGWQFQTGRLLTHGDSLNLTAASWWGDMNYQLNIVPLLGAIASGLPGIPPITIAPPPAGQSNASFCRDSTGASAACQPIRQALSDWKDYFQTLVVAEKNCSVIGQNKSLDNLLASMWAAHTSSLRSGIPLFGAELDKLAPQEAAFGMGWANLVEFIAGAHYHTDLTGTAAQQVLLPMRMLRKGDKAPFIKDMSPETNRGIAMIEAAAAVNKHSGGRILKAWERAMCSEKGREEGRALIDRMIREPKVIVPGIMKLIRDFATQPCDQ